MSHSQRDLLPSTLIWLPHCTLSWHLVFSLHYSYYNVSPLCLKNIPQEIVSALFQCCTSGEQLLLCVQPSPSASVCFAPVGTVHGYCTITVHTQFSLLTLWIFFLDLNVSQRPLTLTLLPLPQHFPFKFSTTPLQVFHLLSRKPAHHITQY